MPTITAAEAGVHLANMNQRSRRPLPAFVSQAVKPVYIFNIYNRTHIVHGFPGGTYIIPACEEGEPYSKPLVIPGIVPEEFDLADGQGNMASNAIEGRKVAEDIVGVKSWTRQLDVLTTNKEWWGVFVAEGEKPTEKELKNAKAKLIQMLTVLLHDGDRLHSERDHRFPPMPIHREAAAYLKQKREWNSEPEQRTECPACGTNIKSNLAVCPSCTAVLDMALAIKYFPDKYGKKAV